MLLNKNQEVDVKLDPNNGKKTIFNKIMNLGSGKLKVAFIYNKTAKTSAWTYAHDLGRLHLIEKFKEDIETIFYDNITEETIEECLKRCVDEKCDVIFTTTPVFVQASVKAAIANPTIRILNCSLRTSHRYIRTYYARMYEAKFLMGIIAGVMTENKRIAYIADYPIRGSIANVNAFAFGVKMVNPKARVFVEWSSIKGFDKKKRLEELGVDIVSDKDMVIPQEKEKSYGLYRIIDDEISALAMPVWQWGEFYEQMVRTIINGTWKSDDNAAEKKAINYWWGMSAGVIDAIGSRNVPEEPKKRMELFKLAIIRGEYDLFYGEIHSQDGCVHGNPDQKFSSEEIIMMNWLADNVEGYIPEDDELVERSLPTIKLQGIEKKGN